MWLLHGRGEPSAASAIKTVDAATENETDDFVGAGETLVDKEATADKIYAKAKVDQAVDQANATASATTAAEAAKSDTEFPEGETIGVPGIYIDISGIHADFLLPMFNSGGALIGYAFFSFNAAGGGAGWGIFDITGFTDGEYVTKIYPATYNPEKIFDWFVPTTMDGLNKMTLYAVNAATASNKTNYSVITGNTCIGYVVDTMDEADLWPVPCN